MNDETIFALSSGLGKAGIAVFRISGPAARFVLEKFTDVATPINRHVHRIRVINPQTKDFIDDGLALYFQGPNSFTGEDVVELHLHGSNAVIKEIIALLGDWPTLRQADPGEFTRKAFDNGKLDLTAVEGLADLVKAETRAQRQQAQRQLRGELSTLYNGWHQKLLSAMALFEVDIDFSEEDLPENLLEQAKNKANGVRKEMKRHLEDSERGRMVREGFYVAIIGPPNSGKSSLLNKLAQHDIAIVSDSAGTTRDVLEVNLDLGGFSVVLADTAGLRETYNKIEKEGVMRALDRADTADLCLAVFDGAYWPELDKTTLSAVKETNVLAVVNKTDLGFEVNEENADLGTVLGISVRTGEGLERLLGNLTNEVEMRCQTSDNPGLTRNRHITALKDSVIALERFRSAPEVELAAEDLRLAARGLGKITGRVEVDAILDSIFSEFCIGK